MTRKMICSLLSLVVLLAACQQHNTAPMSSSSPVETQPPATITEVPTMTALPTLTPMQIPTTDTSHMISVTDIQERPDKTPEHETRDDGFSEVDPWYIADAFRPQIGMRFLALEITALNLSDTNWQFNGSKLVLTDSTGKRYPSQLGRAYKSLMLFELRTGQKSQGWVVFEIPEDAVPKEIQYPLDQKRWITAPVDVPAQLPSAAPHTVTSASASASNLTLSLLAIKDPGMPFSIFTYTYITGYCPLNVMVEIKNLSDREVMFRPHQFVLMDENGVLHFNQPGGASESFDGDDLQPGETRTGEVSFDLPDGVEPSQLFYIVTPYTDEFLQINLR